MKKASSIIVLAVMFVVTLPSIAQADDPVVTQVIWDRTGAENLPCPDGARWGFTQGGDQQIYNVSIHLGDNGEMGFGFPLEEPVAMPRVFLDLDAVWPVAVDTVVDYTYIGTGSPDDHLVLESCLESTDPIAIELAEVKAQLSAARTRVAVLEDAVARALAVRGNPRNQLRNMRTILRGVV